MIEDHDKDRHASVVGWRLSQENSTLSFRVHLWSMSGSPEQDEWPWWGEEQGEATCRTPNSSSYPCSLPVLAQTGSREWEEPHPTHLQDEQEVPADRVEAVGEGFRAAREAMKVLGTWTPGSGQELTHACCVPPDGGCPSEGLPAGSGAHPRHGKCHEGNPSSTSFKTESEASLPCESFQRRGTLPFHI